MRLTNANAPAIVISAHPAGPRTRSNDVITVTFSRSMKTATVEAAFQLSPPSDGHFEWTNENQTFTFVPDAPLVRTNYSVRILGFAENAEGGTLDGNFDSASQSSPADDFVWTFSFPVANDDFADAEAISSETGTAIGTTRNAYPETTEPNHADSPLSSPSVWYRWTAPDSRWFTFDTLRGVTSFDTLLAVYTGTNLADLAAVAANDNYESSTRSRTTFAAVAGQIYQIAVAGKSIDENKADLRNSSFGSVELAWYPTPPPLITSVTPTSGYPGQTITLSGTNFTGATAVKFNGTSADFLPSTNGNVLDLQLVVTVPLNATTGPITIETPHGNATTTNSFSLLVRPALTIRSLPDKRVELSWPAINGFALQRADSLTSTSVWVGATLLSSRVAEGIRYATLTNAVPSRYFRLHRP